MTILETNDGRLFHVVAEGPNALTVIDLRVVRAGAGYQVAPRAKPAPIRLPIGGRSGTGRLFEAA